MSLNKNEIIKLLRQELPELTKKYGVSRIGLFGSYATDSFTDESDIDLIVELSNPIGFEFFDLISHLENLLGKKIDLLTAEGVKNIRQKEISSSIERNAIYVEAA